MTLPVRLKYTTSQAFEVGGVSSSYTIASIKVQNLAFAKDVQLHRNNGDGTWTDVPAKWVGTGQNYDVFSDNAPLTQEFALRYIVNGATYWDNNDGANYQVPVFTNRVGGNVVLNRATARRGTEVGGGFVFTTSWVEGEIYVNNLSPSKQVGIRVSADGGSSWQDTDAAFSGPATDGTYATTSGVEVWKFKTPELNLNPASDVFLLAAYYHDLPSGQWFWDNDFDQNYVLSNVDGAALS
jgi:hypothetical protein